MKKAIVLALAAGLLTMKGYSQDTTKTLLHLPKVNTIGIYIAPEYQYGQLKNEFTSFKGGSVMVLLNKKLALGAFMERSERISPAGISPLYLSSEVSGFKLEYTCKPNSAFHLSFPLMIGMGQARTDSANHEMRREFGNHDSLEHAHKDFERANRNEYFVIQPGVMVEANVLKYLKLFAGANYRFAIAERTTTLSANDLTGLSISVGMKLGLFDFPLNRKK